MYQTSKSKGQELVAQRMVHYFNKLGHEAYLITSTYHDWEEVVSEGSMGDRSYVIIRDSDLGIPIIRVGSLISKWPPRRILFKDVIDTLEKIVNDFHLNVLITHSTLWNGPEEVAKFVEWRRNITALGGFHDLLIFCHMSHFQEPSSRRYSLSERSFRMAWNRLALRTILRVANLILVVTPYEKDEKVKMGAERDKCVLFPGGVDDDTFAMFATTNPQELLGQLKIASDAKIISFLGTIEKRKNPTAILDVAEKMADRKDIQFIIAGRGESEYGDEVKKRASGLPNVTCLGEIDEKSKTQLIRLSYLNLILSRMEALGLAQLEYMFQGVPVITSAIGGQSWLIKDGQEGIHVDGPNDIEGAAKAVLQLVDNPSERERLSHNSMQKAKEFTFTKLIGKLDHALSTELERESGLSNLAQEVRSTLEEPEVVLKTWSHGQQRVMATGKRIFIQKGRLSRDTIELPYSKIGSIEHVRRYGWRPLLLGLVITLLLFIQHYVFQIFSLRITSYVSGLLHAITGVTTNYNEFLVGLFVLPACIAGLVFAAKSRRGYSLQVAGSAPIHLSQSFSEPIKFIREMCDKMDSKGQEETSTHASRKEEEKD